MTQQGITCIMCGLDEGGHPGSVILIYPLRCMMFQAVRNERAHGSVGRRHVNNQHVAGSNPRS